MADVVYHGTRKGLESLMKELSEIFAGRASDTYGVLTGYQHRLSNALLSQVQQDFITKSRGGTGRDGIKWAPLKPETIAYSRRITKKEFKDAGVKRGERGVLTPEENRRWKSIYSKNLSRLQIQEHLSHREAKAIAAKIAWSVLKSQGAKTIIGLFGSRKVDILRDTGLLFRSLSPGLVADQPSTEEGQIRRFQPGEIIVGTNVKPWHHPGIPNKLPSRPFWPLDGSIPDAWWAAIQDAALRGLEIAAKQVVEGNPR